MLRKAGRFAATLTIAYATMIAILWALQDNFIYPASQTIIDPPPGYDVVMLTTSDGLSLRSFAKPAAGELPTVVYFHGNGGTLSSAANATRLLAEAGYGLLLVEYRGYGSNPGEPSEQGFFRDGRAAMAWLNARGIVPRETVIAGNSIGGGTAVQMALEYSPRALMLAASFTSLPNAAKDAVPFVPTHWLIRDKFDNASKIGQLNMPIFIMHGTADEVVDFKHGERLAQIAKSAHFQRFDGAGHALSFREPGQQAQLNWLNQIVGGGAGE